MEVAAQHLNERKPGKSLFYLKLSKEDKEDFRNGFYQCKKHEFIWRGMMYDVVHDIIDGDLCWYLVYPDKKETAVLLQSRLLHAHAGNKLANEKSSHDVNGQFNWFSADNDVAFNPMLVYGRESFSDLPEQKVKRFGGKIEKPPQHEPFLIVS